MTQDRRSNYLIMSFKSKEAMCFVISILSYFIREKFSTWYACFGVGVGGMGCFIIFNYLDDIGKYVNAFGYTFIERFFV